LIQASCKQIRESGLTTNNYVSIKKGNLRTWGAVVHILMSDHEIAWTLYKEKHLPTRVRAHTHTHQK